MIEYWILRKYLRSPQAWFLFRLSMAKNYKRKIYLENMSRDSERCNDIRKPINSSNRQEAKRDIKQELEDDGVWYDWCDDYPHEDPEDWKYYAPMAMLTTGGRFVSTLMRLGILEGGPHKDFIDLMKKLRHKNFFYHPHHDLLEKLAVSPDGIIYSDTASDSKKQ